jgi:hypothetical protein
MRRKRSEEEHSKGLERIAGAKLDLKPKQKVLFGVDAQRVNGFSAFSSWSLRVQLVVCGVLRESFVLLLEVDLVLNFKDHDIQRRFCNWSCSR